MVGRKKMMIKVVVCNTCRAFTRNYLFFSICKNCGCPTYTEYLSPHEVNEGYHQYCVNKYTFWKLQADKSKEDEA